MTRQKIKFSFLLLMSAQSYDANQSEEWMLGRNELNKKKKNVRRTISLLKTSACHPGFACLLGKARMHGRKKMDKSRSIQSVCYLYKCIDVWQSNISADCTFKYLLQSWALYCHIKVISECINNSYLYYISYILTQYKQQPLKQNFRTFSF